jgi:hypothetical protein
MFKKLFKKKEFTLSQIITKQNELCQMLDQLQSKQLKGVAK